MEKGVNLGNWLVLEKWMSPELFAGTDAEDETYLCLGLDDVAKRERFKVHRDTWINDRDFAWIAGHGLDFVRLPVPYFVFGGRDPFVSCIEYVDAAFRWAERHGVRILVTLHTVPDSQNGFDNGGLTGVCKFHKNPEHVEFALTVLEQLAERYGNRPNLWGIEVLNEPISPELWELIDVPKRYPAVDKEYAKGSEGVPSEFLRDYYTRAYERIRSRAGDARIVFHDGFRIAEWPGFFDGWHNIMLDTHLYVMMHTVSAPGSTLDDYVRHIESEFGDVVREMSPHFPLLVGEWNIDTKSPELAELPRDERRVYLSRIAEAHLSAFDGASAWCYWAYRLNGDTPETDMWDMSKALELGYLPAGLAP
jgi:glucan 1,3-beta-glucosidase